MNSRKLRFAIFGNIYQAKKSASMQQILACLGQRQANVLIEREFYNFLTVGQRLEVADVQVFNGSDFEADFAISLGGDGTFLRAASLVGDKNIPILGVNMGRLGFLADVRAQDVEQTIAALYDGDYTVESRSVIQVETDSMPLSGYCCALNDVAILKRDNASMITIHATIDGDYVTTYQADGLVMSTPTGSTAYSLSVGGPIIVPGTRVFSLTAVAPHSLNVRPIVLSENAEILLSVESRTHNYLVALDGRSEPLPDSVRLRLHKAPYRVQVVKRAGTKYFHTLREKMMWGADQRG
ncbi:MAG: NAD kinase [Prevotella sp.]|nr:NAD kinase [Prevotella sp.]MBQ9203690.1 NAD kinase [Prevotella sp.]